MELPVEHGEWSSVERWRGFCMAHERAGLEGCALSQLVAQSMAPAGSRQRERDVIEMRQSEIYM